MFRRQPPATEQIYFCRMQIHRWTNRFIALAPPDHETRQGIVMSPVVIQTACQPEKCPLCGEPNDCQLCTHAAYKGPCWCVKAKIPDELIARVPPDLQSKACICRVCVLTFQRQRSVARKIVPGDFYFDAGGLMVFTAAYHLQRGYCCGSGCRHCPYVGAKPLSLPA